MNTKGGGTPCRRAFLLIFIFGEVKKMLYSIPKAAKTLGLDRQTVVRAIEKGQIKAVEIGARRLIPQKEIKRLTDEES